MTTIDNMLQINVHDHYITMTFKSYQISSDHLKIDFWCFFLSYYSQKKKCN